MDDFPGSGHHSEASPDSAVFVGRYDDLRRSVSEDMKVYTKAMPHGLKKVHSSLPTTLKSKIPVGQRSGVMASEQKNAKVKALGHLRLRDEDTNEVILVPTPSYDPKDPLNWYLSVGSHLPARKMLLISFHILIFFPIGQNGSSSTLRWQYVSQ